MPVIYTAISILLGTTTKMKYKDGHLQNFLNINEIKKTFFFSSGLVSKDALIKCCKLRRQMPKKDQFK